MGSKIELTETKLPAESRTKNPPSRIKNLSMVLNLAYHHTDCRRSPCTTFLWIILLHRRKTWSKTKNSFWQNKSKQDFAPAPNATMIALYLSCCVPLSSTPLENKISGSFSSTSSHRPPGDPHLGQAICKKNYFATQTYEKYVEYWWCIQRGFSSATIYSRKIASIQESMQNQLYIEQKIGV